MKQKIQSNQWWLLIIVIVVLLGIVNWQSFSHQTVAQVQSVQVIKRHNQEDSYQNHDQRITQKLRVKILNGPKRGQKRTLSNTYLQSQANTNRYFVHTQLFIGQDQKNQHFNIIGPKRDGVLLFMLLIVSVLLIGLLKKSGWQALSSALINVLFFVGALVLTTKWQNQHILAISLGLTLLVTLSTLWIIFGHSRQTLIAVVATLSSTLLALGVSALILQLSHNEGIHFETLNYGIQPFELVFFAETLLGVLGAVMDETTDITASLHQLLQEQPQISAKDIFQSGLVIGREIIGPLVNILFFIFIAELIPIVVLYLRNGNTLGFALSRTMTLGYTQTVISAIGIVLAVPITTVLAGKWLRGYQA